MGLPDLSERRLPQIETTESAIEVSRGASAVVITVLVKAHMGFSNLDVVTPLQRSERSGYYML